MCWNIDYFKKEREEDARQISEYKKKISEINYEIEKQLAKNNEIEKNNNIILKEIETLKTEAISLFKEKYNETIKFDISHNDFGSDYDIAIFQDKYKYKLQTVEEYDQESQILIEEFLYKINRNNSFKSDITYSINKDYKSLAKAKINLSLDSIKELENKLINLKRHRKKLFELKLLTRNLYI